MQSTATEAALAFFVFAILSPQRREHFYNKADHLVMVKTKKSHKLASFCLATKRGF